MEDKLAKDRDGKLNWNVNNKEIIKWKFNVGRTLINITIDTDSDDEKLACFEHNMVHNYTNTKSRMFENNGFILYYTMNIKKQIREIQLI